MSKPKASIFEMDGVPEFGQALPLALQHVVAMIVGCVTPSIIVAGVADLNASDRVILIQAALFVSAISTLLQLFPVIRGKSFQLGAKLPVIMGSSFASVPRMQAIPGSRPHSARAAASISLPTSTRRTSSSERKTRRIIAVCSSNAQPAP